MVLPTKLESSFDVLTSARGSVVLGCVIKAEATVYRSLSSLYPAYLVLGNQHRE